MKKGTLLILVYTVVIAAIIGSVKLAQYCTAHNQTTPEIRVASCDDPPPTPLPSE